jgi:transposase InsO family protein
VSELQQKYPIMILLKISGVSKSTYYYTRNKDDKDLKNEELMQEIISIYEEHKKRYGYRRITLALRNKGFIVNHKKVKRLMKVLNLYGITPKAKYKSYKDDMNGTCKNVLLNKVIDKQNHTTYYKRNFSTTGCNQKWATDVSEFHIAAGKLYLSTIIDMHNRQIISFNISQSPNYNQTQDMLDSAFTKEDTLDGLILHSDQGWQYQMQQYHTSLSDKGIIQSMSRKGNCLDNSLIENFFGIMKREMFYGHQYEFQSLEDLKTSMEQYIDYYNNQRITTKLKGLTPVQYRNQSLTSIIA